MKRHGVPRGKDNNVTFKFSPILQFEAVRYEATDRGATLDFDVSIDNLPACARVCWEVRTRFSTFRQGNTNIEATTSCKHQRQESSAVDTRISLEAYFFQSTNKVPGTPLRYGKEQTMVDICTCQYWMLYAMLHLSITVGYLARVAHR